MKPRPRKNDISKSAHKFNTQYNIDLYYEAYTYYKATLLYYLRLQTVDLSKCLDGIGTKSDAELMDPQYAKDNVFISQDMMEAYMTIMGRGFDV